MDLWAIPDLSKTCFVNLYFFVPDLKISLLVKISFFFFTFGAQPESLAAAPESAATPFRGSFWAFKYTPRWTYGLHSELFANVFKKIVRFRPRSLK